MSAGSGLGLMSWAVGSWPRCRASSWRRPGSSPAASAACLGAHDGYPTFLGAGGLVAHWPGGAHGGRQVGPDDFGMLVVCQRMRLAFAGKLGRQWMLGGGEPDGLDALRRGLVVDGVFGDVLEAGDFRVAMGGDDVLVDHFAQRVSDGGCVPGETPGVGCGVLAIGTAAPFLGR